MHGATFFRALPRHCLHAVLPSVLNRLDVEPKRGRDGVNVLPDELLQNGRLTSVVQATRAQCQGTNVGNSLTSCLIAVVGKECKLQYKP